MNDEKPHIETLRRFQKAYEQEYGIVMTEEQALDEFSMLCELYRLVYLTELNQDQIDAIRNRQDTARMAE